MTLKPIHVIGGGMAGSEASWQIAQAGVPVVLHEMRGTRGTEAHQTDQLAELVCSNSFRSDDHTANAVGVLHEEMRRAGGLIITTAKTHQVPAGSALAVDREGFAEAVTAKLEAHPLVTIVREEIAGIPPEDWDSVIVATGPLTSINLAEAIRAHTGETDLAFFDAIAPIVYFDSVDMTKAWRQSRYDKAGPGGDTEAYINCPMTEEEYNRFLDALLAAPKTEFKDWEKNTPYFEGCLPIEVMAERGRETLRWGPMKPVGLTNPHNPTVKAHAIVQLRQDNALGTLWNMVGFQTKLKYGAQTEIFRMIPGLETAEFARLGGIHRNTFLNSPKLLDRQLRMKTIPRLRFAGQVTGVEGYVESAAMGLLAGRLAAAERLGRTLEPPPPTTAMGALVNHITGGHLAAGQTFQPMNVNFGLFPDIEDYSKTDPDGKRLRGKDKGKSKKMAQAVRALEDFDAWLAGAAVVAAE
ncbi:MAG: methylenetetrahydrofolate--tRNA-(uracil(54)-C(5))-methyltransferase (FADH(2)-oxidizing) TrmFO [Hyphomonas sp.]|uniref:methylenetetrahydrofolate--tRNA-(uracil(54)- C(5))-methyltransferase (FADH(2)-oxidizing) TrmFO n=1 Tax=Hyphomonas sp. TaxID=87 RepID=UPI001819A035|nr:methylenetetrahydrofolate--tRNA-(uracil(54)-C(5))-methyltransferase (FADH(2)-oxidizing) TrmFO [Hyphomonas sp.]MBA3067057.1 methylenetetrahydrofolate--tRNA-(uracil(54)-C(5))-methyltransferase (FADH(2)-oxidizing) TrmFO [Hyphomonas sp.]MBU3921139.1 methylenetetrahydrofolate--tRNA-(uracil(54)-C(5))-methyltransferase (FADH(2)-oxidizing) TrmFO [Alphaproteobacteria bacterium]MBU4063148.1 methylenetetrahydrofolate--tRNA-(uracil(54)-C(5))-methyltransferase (FADH(2)-oxidizing) TrmFO [Alphaproteobacteri